jgi:3-oxoacyl-[acyl-carrier protein] reductase
MLNVIVSGGSRGIGLAICRKLAASGYQVIAVARKETDECRFAIAEQAGAGVGRLHFAPFDLGEVQGLGEFVATLRKQYGPIYGLVNNAGIGTEGVLANMRNHDIERLVRINTLSPLILTKFVVRSMMAEGSGRIVNISSIIGSTGYSGLSAYGATKASLLGFTRSLAREVGRAGITVNAVAPGFIETELTSGLGEQDRARVAQRSALRRMAEPQDVANMVEFLMSEKARNITGTVMTVDAGNTA